MTKKQPKKLPDIVYVYWEDDGDDDVWLMASEKIDDAAEKGDKKLVGIYKLESLVNVSLEVKAEQAK